MRKLYGSNTWRRTIAMIVALLMVFSVLQTSGYYVFAEDFEGDPIAEEAIAETAEEPVLTLESTDPAVTEDEPAEEASSDPADFTEESPVIEEEPAEEESPADVDVEPEDSVEDPADAELEAEAELEADAEPVEASEEGEDPADAEPETDAELVEEAEEAEPAEETLISEAAQVIAEDDGEEIAEPETDAEPVEGAEEAVEELLEEPVEELVVIDMPVIEAEKLFEDARVTVAAPEGAFPEGTTVNIEEVTLGRTQVAAVANAVEEKVVSYKAYDITFNNGDQTDMQPADGYTVKVNIEPYSMPATDNLQVVHMEDRKTATVVESETTEEGLAFDAEHFSVYVVVASGVDPYARATVIFKSGDVEMATFYVKNNDTPTALEDIIYDPGVGELAQGKVFRGWYISSEEDADYTTTSATKTVEDVRSYFESLEITEGDTYYVHAMIFDAYTVAYKSDTGLALETETVLAVNGEAVEYKVEHTFEPENPDTQQFQGWFVSGSVTDLDGNPIPANTAIVVGTTVKIGGNATFKAKAPTGNWLIFKENHDRASYTLPQFLEGATETWAPDDPTCFGYTFKGWYTDEECTDANKFEFGSSITEKTYLYAKWIENETTTFTVIVWKENVEGDGYDFADSVSITTAPNETATEFVAIDGEGAAAKASVNGGTPYSFKGFHYDSMDATNEDIIKADGTTVVNVYYARTNYTLKFYYARSRERNNGRKEYQVSSNYNAENPNTWNGSGTTEPGCTFGTKGTEERGGYTYYYTTLTAKYGTYIGDDWPKYDQFDMYGNYRLGSWAIMHSSQAYINDGQGTIKGKITIMDEQILGDLESEDGNYVYANYDTVASQYDWIYHIYFKNETGTYEHYEDVSARSHDSGSNWETQQHAPAYPGMEEVRRVRVGNNREINYYYDPLVYQITFMDGKYVDGDGVELDDRSAQVIKSTEEIAYNASISSYNGGPVFEGDDGANFYEPQNGDYSGFSRTGYTFAGWYIDKSCTTAYTFNKMPLGGVVVYAKWIRDQYRVFLHPNVPTTDTSFQMGDQSTSFRVDYGETMGIATAKRDEYKLLAWYYDEECKHVFSTDAYAMNESTPGLAEYVKSRPTETDQYGNATDTINKDNNNNRFWITQSLDLYAKWSAFLPGADGINIVYDATDKGTTAPTDELFYSDRSNAVAGAAATAKNGETEQFLYWVIQKWNGQTFEDTTSFVYPGDTFEVFKDYSKVTENEGSTEANPSYTYTMQLRAEYGLLDTPTPTHLYWYGNGGTAAAGTTGLVDGRNDLVKSPVSVQINEAFGILPATTFTRDGYEFVGWAKVEEPKTLAGFTQDNSVTAWLVFEDDAFKVTSGETEIVAEQLAADEVLPYNAMYAVWEEGTVTINYAVASDSTGMGTVSLTEETVKTFTGTAAGSTATPASDNYVFDYWTCDEGTESISTTAQFVPSKNASGSYETHTYYAHFKEKTANLTVHHYLKGTTTKVAEDVVSAMKVGTQLNPSTIDAAKTFLDTYANYTLTKDSTNPTTAVTIEANGAEITLYYTLPLTITAATASKKYDGLPLNGSYTIEGELSIDTAAIETALGTAPSITNVSESPKNYLTEEEQAQITGIPGYYAVSYTPGTLTINKGDGNTVTPQKDPDDDKMAVAGNNLTVVYDGNSHTVTAEATKAGSTIYYSVDGGQTWTEEAPSRINVGTTEFDVKATNPNYVDAYARDCKLIVTPAPITVNETANRDYTGGDQTLTIFASSAEGVVDGENLTLTGATITGKEPADYTTVSNYTWSVAKADGSDSTDNYTIEVTGRLTIIGRGHLTIEKTTTTEAPKTGYALGDTIEYLITVTNDGKLTITNIKVEDELTGKTGEDAWSIDSLAPGEFREFATSYTVTEADILEGKVINEATATGTSPDPDTPNVPVTPDTTEDPTEPKNGHLTVTKDTTSTPKNGKTYELGEEIAYTITVTNDGNLTITNITVTDELTGNVDNKAWTIESLAPGKSETFRTTYTVTEKDIAAGKVVNEATAEGTSPDLDKPDVPVKPGTKEDPTEPAEPEADTYTIIYHANYLSKVESEGDEVITVEEATSIVTYSAVRNANNVGFTKPDPWTNTRDGKTYTYTFAGWKDKNGNEYKALPYTVTNSMVEKTDEADNNDQPATNEAGAVNTATSSLRSGLRMAFTTSFGGTLELWAQWTESTSGGGTNPRPNNPDPTDEPEEPIDDPDTPLAPGTIDDDPGEEIDEPDTPLAPYEEETEIDEEETPLSPFTGDDRHTDVWAFLSILSLAGIVLLGRKRRGEE